MRRSRSLSIWFRTTGGTSPRPSWKRASSRRATVRREQRARQVSGATGVRSNLPASDRRQAQQGPHRTAKTNRKAERPKRAVGPNTRWQWPQKTENEAVVAEATWFTVEGVQGPEDRDGSHTPQRCGNDINSSLICSYLSLVFLCSVRVWFSEFLICKWKVPSTANGRFFLRSKK
jgi:hypothetical protein